MTRSSDAAAAALTMPTWLFLLLALACFASILTGVWVLLCVLVDSTIGRHFRRKIEQIEQEAQESERRDQEPAP